MDVAVIICTYNRAEQLRRTLEGFRGVSAVRGPQSEVSWELIVVDNNSTDATKAVCAEFESRLPLRYRFEGRPGKSRALNRAIAEVCGPKAEDSRLQTADCGLPPDLLIFTDDDVDVSPDWLTAYVDAAARHPEADFFGGKVIPRWETPPPRWLAEHFASLLHGVTVSVDKGPAERPARVEEGLFFGANLALRPTVFAKGFRFPEEIGPTRGEPVRGEDTEMQKQLLAKGHHGVYVPAAVVYHRNPPERMTESYVRQWFKGQGMKRARLSPPEMTGTPVWFGAPRHLWRKLLTHAVRYGATRWLRPARVWLPAEIEMARTWGVIEECRSAARGTR